MIIDSKKTDATKEKSSDRRQISVAHGEIDSRELFQTGRELRIRHGAETYRLRLTTLNKLILTK